MLTGKPFQIDGAATRKARLAKSVLTLGTDNCWMHDDRNEQSEDCFVVSAKDRWDGVRGGLRLFGP